MSVKGKLAAGRGGSCELAALFADVVSAGTPLLSLSLSHHLTTSPAGDCDCLPNPPRLTQVSVPGHYFHLIVQVQRDIPRCPRWVRPRQPYEHMEKHVKSARAHMKPTEAAKLHVGTEPAYYDYGEHHLRKKESGKET